MVNVCYSNTDLEIVSRFDLKDLVRAFEIKKVTELNIWRDGKKYRANLETYRSFPTAEKTITAMLNAIEGFDAAQRALWDRCTEKWFDICYEEMPDSKNVSITEILKPALFARIANAGAGLRVTIYRKDMLVLKKAKTAKSIASSQKG